MESEYNSEDSYMNESILGLSDSYNEDSNIGEDGVYAAFQVGQFLRSLSVLHLYIFKGGGNRLISTPRPESANDFRVFLLFLISAERDGTIKFKK